MSPAIRLELARRDVRRGDPSTTDQLVSDVRRRRRTGGCKYNQKVPDMLRQPPPQSPDTRPRLPKPEFAPVHEPCRGARFRGEHGAAEREKQHRRSRKNRQNHTDRKTYYCHCNDQDLPSRTRTLFRPARSFVSFLKAPAWPAAAKIAPVFSKPR